MDELIRLLSALLMISLPLGMGVLLNRRWKLGAAWRLFAIGALTFLAAQVLHIPFNTWLLNPLLSGMQTNTIQPGFALAVSAALLGLSAGIFEELSRYLVLRLALRQERSWGEMLMFGLGHGGVEAILIGVLALYSFFQALALRQADLTALVPADQLQSIASGLTMYWQAPWYLALIGAFERALAICLHLGLTALVWKAVVQRTFAWAALAVIWHALANAGALILNSIWGLYAAEGFLVLAAGLGLLAVFASRRQEPIGAPIAAPPGPQPAIEIETARAKDDINSTKLDQSRYLD